MKWWNKALIGSTIWTILLVAAIVFMLQRVKQEAVSAEHRRAWQAKLMKTSGSLFVVGHAALWGVLWSRERRKTL